MESSINNSPGLKHEKHIFENADLTIDPNNYLIPDNPQNQKKKKQFQIRIFFLTYLTFSVLHFNRESWAQLKSKIQSEEGISTSQLGYIDTIFLCCYSIGLFVSGSMGDHYSPKMLLVIAYICITLVITIISIGAQAGLTNPFFFCFFFGINGFLQSVGWPSCTAIFANWFGKRGRGAMIGLWASSSNFGNVSGAIFTSFLTSTAGLGWEMTYLLIGQFCLVFALINIFFLVVHPQEQGILIQEYDEQLSETEQLLSENTEDTTIQNESIALIASEANNEVDVQSRGGINFWTAWKIPGVFSYSISYFCIKFSQYGLMLWLPLYLQKMNAYSDYETATATSTLDIGCVFGGVLMGYLTDLTYSRRTPILVVSIILTTVLTVLMAVIDPQVKVFFYFYIFLLGTLMGGAVAIVSGISCADLGKLKELSSNEKSMSTVTGIIDGTGSMGAAFGQLIIGFSEQHFGWDSVFVIMSIMVLASAIPLYKSMRKEFKEIMTLYRINKERKRQGLGQVSQQFMNAPDIN